TLKSQRVAILGAGSSASGISDQIVAAMMGEGLTRREAESLIWLTDSHGLESFKQRYAHDVQQLNGWVLDEPGAISLMDVVRNVHPTILIGTSAQPGAFTEGIVREMAKHTERPVIFPLSNPTSKSEAVPADLINWTDG